jgi:hypothetical protein
VAQPVSQPAGHLDGCLPALDWPMATLDDHQRRPVLTGQHRLWSGISNASKPSFRSFTTSSFEADDERSSYGSMSDRDRDPDRDPGGDPRRPSLLLTYPGQDVRPTSRKELMGWYMYAFAAETYVICGIGMCSFGAIRSSPSPPASTVPASS